MSPSDNYKRVNLGAGQLYIAEEPTVIWTVLGSCLAVVFHHPFSRLGAICHAQLPEEGSHDHLCSDFCPHPCYTDVPNTERFKFVTCSVRYMYEYFIHNDIPADEIVVKIFGGATMFDIHPGPKSVGESNIETARKMIQSFGLQCVSANIGGSTGRTLYFYSDTGDVLLKLQESRKRAFSSSNPIFVKSPLV